MKCSTVYVRGDEVTGICEKEADFNCIECGNPVCKRDSVACVCLTRVCKTCQPFHECAPKPLSVKIAEIFEAVERNMPFILLIALILARFMGWS